MAAGLLGAQALAHPELRLVDFIEFAGRARGLTEGGEAAVWLSARYPVGYPALLAAGKALLGTVWLAGRALSLLAAVAAVVVTARWLSPWAAAWLLVQPGLLEHGATAGTDMPAVATGLAAIAACRGRGRAWAVAAGLLAGAALMVRYPAAVVAPVVLLGLGRRAGWGLLGIVAATAPHWGAAVAGLGPALPDPAENAEIGGAGGWWPAALRAGQLALGEWPAAAGAAGLLVGVARRDQRAVALLGWAALHLAMLAFFFANTRLLLPASLALALGLAWLVPRRWGPALLVPAGLALAQSWPRALAIEPGAEAREQIVAAAATLRGPFAATSPWFHVRRPDGWIEAATLVRQAVPAGASPAGMPPEALLGWARSGGYRHLVLDVGRVHRSYPALRPLLSRPAPGMVEVARAEGWRIYALDGG